jgi:molybdopterin-guanine dinucleotide biosynthesis protein A
MQRPSAPPGRIAPDRPSITGLVLAGGRGRRMGGIDKGLQPWRGQPLVDHAIARLAPQVSAVMISANRNIEAYGERGCAVVADEAQDYQGPLGGILAGLRAVRTPWLAIVPCDAPLLPADLVARFCKSVAVAASEGVGPSPAYEGAVAQRDVEGNGPRIEPVVCLLPADVADDLARYLHAGGRKVEPWLLCHARPVSFDRAEDRGAFANFNSLDDLHR